ncbi:hypothetical protein UlMin_001272 [Ulmus minor]
MAKLIIPLLVLCLLMFSTTAKQSTPNSRLNFIRASCRTTTYPALCVQCLAGYAKLIRQSERQLARTALAVTLSRARSTTAFVAKMTKVKGIKPREYQAVKDCIENMGDSVDLISESIREIGHMGRPAGPDFVWHMNNVQTWVSAALTDEDTCLDGFSGRVMDGKVKTAIRRRVVNVAQVTSNSLALVNSFASKHRP